ncbi:hypothetical protein CPC08DRAFT_650854, partial [Agrocybe pediades]
QLNWEAHVVEYVDFLHHETAVHGNATSKAVPVLKKDIPLLGPRFLSPSFYHTAKREGSNPEILPDLAYIKPLTIIHPVYFGVFGLSRCPQCQSTEILWDAWTATGARDVHGIRREERAIGYQLHCKMCKEKYGKGGSQSGQKKSCFATTSKFFWEKWEHWRIPSKYGSLFCEITYLKGFRGRTCFHEPLCSYTRVI